MTSDCPYKLVNGHPRTTLRSSSQADNEGSIPFTRATIFKASNLLRYSKVSVKVSVSGFHRIRTISNRHQRFNNTKKQQQDEIPRSHWPKPCH